MINMSSKVFYSLASTAFFVAVMAVSCTAQPNEQQALENLRRLTAGGQLPAESVVADIEKRFSRTATGSLAKLLRARIRFENKDFTGAAAILDSDEFAARTSLADHALWLRGRALQNAGDHKNAMAVFEELLSAYPGALRANEARRAWAESAIQTGDASRVPAFLADLNEEHSAGALLLTAKAYEAAGDQPQAFTFYRRTYFYGAGTDAAKEAEAKLNALTQPLTPQNAEEAAARADKLFAAKKYADAEKAFAEMLASFPASASPKIHLDRLITFASLKKMPDAHLAFNAIPSAAAEKEKAYYELILGYAKNRAWVNARQMADDMRAKMPDAPLTVKAWVDAGYAARDAKNKGEETHFLRTALINYPQAVEVAGAQFELAWLEHESGNTARAADMLIEHLARYADKDTSNRGRAGYWSARNAEKAGRIAEACALYDAVVYRYSANWYGHIGFERLTSLRGRGQCQTVPSFAPDSLVPQAAANLKTVTVAPETARKAELARAVKSEELGTIGIFDWAMEELREAQKTAQNSPKINLALAKLYQMRGDNVNALLTLAKSYPDYAQMFPEEMGREEWSVFYPHVAWDQIAAWAKHRNLDIFLVAGLIRQESVFNPQARSSANAYGLMQLLVPTAQLMARKNGSTARVTGGRDLYQPALNIELGTAYMREQLDKYGRIEYMAVAYNAGPGRVVTWRRTLPMEMDEFVEAIPFRETKGYVQGIIRNTAQYRRLYDESGNFKPNVGSKPLRAEIDSKPNEQLAVEFPEIVLDKRNSE